ncbi:MAG: efflux RND transporter periplasmic adaptor subunit [Bacteroidetes bacterium]|nr:efflux RND transporter periplasmic adaptor subunit [Bacteroidota bacterium]MBS1979012.1 efflux RND transporter periplasmic adaptor subunit [Bacteroidota bacterium]
MKRTILIIVVLSLVLGSACSQKSDTKKTPPSSIENPVKESQLTTIKLTESAVQRLGIKTQALEERESNRTRTYSGEVTAVPGQSMTMTAPVSGTILGLPDGKLPLAGSPVRKGQVLYRLLILPSEKDLMSAQEDVKLRQVQFEVATEKLKRAQQLYKDKAGSLRALQDAEAELANISAGLRVAEARVELMKGNSGNNVSEKLSTLNIESAVTGFIQRVYASPSQVVSANAPVMDVSALSPLWVRVPVYAGDLTLVDSKQPAHVRNLSDFNGSKGDREAMPVNGPQTADPLSSSADFFYEITNQDGLFRPGQRVSVTLSIKSQQKALEIPFSAIVYDIYGGTWVYEMANAETFIRRRVEVTDVDGGIALLRRGPAPGTMIVTEGTAELFGTEFGGAK